MCIREIVFRDFNWEQNLPGSVEAIGVVGVKMRQEENARLDKNILGNKKSAV